MVRTLLRRTAAAWLCAVAATAALAADPQPGMWNFDGELTGKPGRGFQIDTQGGKRLILSYFGYRADGSALFLQASGERADDGSFEADLVEYRGGTVLGGAHQDGESAQVVGQVQVRFDSSTHGSITLPGEAPRLVKRFQYEDHAQRFRRDYLFRVNRYHWDFGDPSPVGLDMHAENGVFSMTETQTRQLGDGSTQTKVCLHTGSYTQSGNGLQSTGTVQCDGEAETSYRAEDLVVSRDGFYTGTFFYGDAGGDAGTRHQGVCVYRIVFIGTTRCSF